MVRDQRVWGRERGVGGGAGEGEDLEEVLGRRWRWPRPGEVGCEAIFWVGGCEGLVEVKCSGWM